MISLASRRRIIPSATLVRKSPFSRKNPRCSLLSTLNAGNKPVVISRRAWIEWKNSKGITRKPPDPSKKNAKGDEKPWPRNVQIAGYFASAVAVPYILLWTITSNPTLRDWFGPYIPLEKLRTYYGTLEWDAQSYSEELEDKNNNLDESSSSSSSLIEYYRFPEEDPYKVRRQQETIENMNDTDVTVTVSVSSSSSSSLVEDVVTKKVSSKTIANEANLLGLLPSGLASLEDTHRTVGVDFLDRENQEHSNSIEGNDTISDGSLMKDDDDDDSMATGRMNLVNSRFPHQDLARETQSMSIWAHVPQQQESKQGSDSFVQKLTDVEMKMGQLEYEIAELEKNLRDPMCTRDIDDMSTELRNAKRELSNLKWKRRLRLV